MSSPDVAHEVALQFYGVFQQTMLMSDDDVGLAVVAAWTTVPIKPPAVISHQGWVFNFITNDGHPFRLVAPEFVQVLQHPGDDAGPLPKMLVHGLFDRQGKVPRMVFAEGE
jgi:hypothetical protein